MDRLRTLASLTLAVAVATSSGCIAYQSQEAPETPRNLPVSEPRWTMGSIAGPHAEVVAQVIAASGAADDDADGATSKNGRVFVWVDEVVVGPGALDFVSGLTLTTVPLMRWHELKVRGELVAPTGRVVGAAESRSEVGVLFGWPMIFAIPLWTDFEGSRVVKAQVRKLARAVLSSLVTQDDAQRPKAPAAPPPAVVEIGPAR